MSFLDILVLDIILMIFPITMILLIRAYYRNSGKFSSDFLIDIANFTSLFLLIKYCHTTVVYDVLLLNIPLVISVIYNRKISTCIIAIILVYFNVMNGDNIIASISEYLFYILIFVILSKNCKNHQTVCLVFICIKGVFLTIDEFYIKGHKNIECLLSIFLSLVVFYLIAEVVIKIIKKQEETISLTQTLKELEKEKSLKNSLFKITHEVKNPIAVCKGYLSMIDYDNKKKAQEYNEIILGEIDRALDIMDNFSKYTKINVSLEPMDLDCLICDVRNSLMPLFKNNNIIFNYNYDDEIYINGDYKRLKQVFINTLKNSVEAISNKGNIDVSVKVNTKEAVVKIKDNGCGISKENLNKIGNLFYTSKDKGCGIGVALSKEIIKLHNGNLKYKSKENSYTEAIIKLPILKV